MTYNPLNSKWTVWIHHMKDSDWSLESYISLYTFDSIEGFWSFANKCDAEFFKMYMIFVMKDGILPIWECDENKNGGYWSFKIPTSELTKTFESLMIHSIIENVSTNTDMKVHGITSSPKCGFHILKIWVNDSKHSNKHNFNKDIKFLKNMKYMPFMTKK